MQNVATSISHLRTRFCTAVHILCQWSQGIPHPADSLSENIFHHFSCNKPRCQASYTRASHSHACVHSTTTLLMRVPLRPPTLLRRVSWLRHITWLRVFHWRARIRLLGVDLLTRPVT